MISQDPGHSLHYIVLDKAGHEASLDSREGQVHTAISQTVSTVSVIKDT